MSKTGYVYSLTNKPNETHASIEEAIHREKCMKEWQRAWKLKRINEMNPDWRDLYDDICR